jgi:hypothetical protein
VTITFTLDEIPMKRSFALIALSLFASLVISTSSAVAASSTLLLCKKSSNGALAIRAGRCRSGETKINNIFQVDHTVGFANVNGADGVVTSSGGNGTTSVAAVRNGAGDYTVTFTGKYPAAITDTKLTVLSTARSDNFQVTNANIESASSTSIVVRVFSWKSDVTSEVDSSLFVQVLLGS